MQATYVFDLDGTLVDSRADLACAINLVRGELCLPPLPVPIVASFVGDGVRKLVERATRDAASAVDVDAAVARMREHYTDHLLDNTVLYPGVEDALKALSQTSCQMAIVTNKPEAPAREICVGLGIAHYFVLILGRDSCAQCKPDPGPILEVLRVTGANPTRSWMVGDHATDMEAGRRASLQRCFCRYGFGELRGEKADIEVDSLSQFARHVTTG